jgi:O-antigen/teichoic acid export membrane protein
MEKIKKFFFVNITTKQTIIKNTFWLFAGEAGGRILKMGLIIYAARKLGASGWGIFAYAISIASLLMIFSDIGTDSLITREATQKKEGYRVIVSVTLLLKSIILIISILLVIFVSPYISHIKEAKILFPIVGIIFLFDAIRSIGFAINRVIEKMERETIIKIIMNFIILGLGIVLININPLPISMAIAYATGSISGAILILIIIRKDIANLITKTNIIALKFVIKTVIPFAIITLIGSIMANTDVFMLGIWKTPEDIGVYSAAQRFFQFILIIPSMIATATFPLMSRLANKDNEKFRIILEKTFSVFAIIGIPIAFGGLFLADQIIPLVFGLEYIKAIPVLKILMIMLLFSFPLIILTNTIFVYNEQKKLILANIFGVLANVLLNFLLIPKLGVIGATVATLTSTSIVTCIIWMRMKKINYFEIQSSLKTIVLPVIAMTLFILILKYFGIKIILNIIISSIVYFGVLFLLKKSIFIEIRNTIGI